MLSELRRQGCVRCLESGRCGTVNGPRNGCLPLILLADYKGPHLLLKYEETNSQFGGPDSGEVGKEM